MKKVSVQNLGMIITESCNLNCNHCLRGKCTNKVMSDEVIEATLNQFSHICNLAICGGEPTLALDRLEKIFSYVVENKILVDQVTLVINGTIYSDEFLRLLDYIDDYVRVIGRSKSGFSISWDQYHHMEIERLNMKKEYLENVKRYSESKHFFELQRLNGKLFNEGNAKKLDPSFTKPMVPMEPIITYAGKFGRLDLENGLCNIGPVITVNVDGIITECDASIDHQNTIYNYGNILNDSVEDVYLKRNHMIVKPRKWISETKKQMIKYYNSY